LVRCWDGSGMLNCAGKGMEGRVSCRMYGGRVLVMGECGMLFGGYCRQ